MNHEAEINNLKRLATLANEAQRAAKEAIDDYFAGMIDSDELHKFEDAESVAVERFVREAKFLRSMGVRFKLHTNNNYTKWAVVA